MKLLTYEEFKQLEPGTIVSILPSAHAVVPGEIRLSVIRDRKAPEDKAIRTIADATRHVGFNMKGMVNLGNASIEAVRSVDTAITEMQANRLDHMTISGVRDLSYGYFVTEADPFKNKPYAVWEEIDFVKLKELVALHFSPLGGFVAIPKMWQGS